MQPEVRIAGKLMRFDVNINQITKSHSHINLIGAAHSMRRKTIEMYQNMDLSKISISNKSIWKSAKYQIRNWSDFITQIAMKSNIVYWQIDWN